MVGRARSSSAAMLGSSTITAPHVHHISPQSRAPSRSSRRWVAAAVCILLVAITWLVFGQALGHDFVNFDDQTYVYENTKITGGLSIDSIGWAFSHIHSQNWHPLTTMSHMLDCQLYGLKAGGHHFTNVLLHTVAVLLLFAVLREMSGMLWRSAFVAALFAIHPLHVESVAWIAERKDVLSGVFFMLTLLVYARYARAPSLGRYLIITLLFALGLMCKPMLVTLPFVLLLLDYWPLKRFAPATPANAKSSSARWWARQSPQRQLCLEKIPLLALSAASCTVTLLAQAIAVSPTKKLPLLWRLNNAFVACVTYVWQMMRPVRLVPFYEHPGNRLAFTEIVLSIVIVSALTCVAFTLRRRYAYAFTGWFWYLGMLLPVIGLVQVGMQGHADRYTYLPQIGLYIIATWAAADLSSQWPYSREILSAGAAAVIASLMWCAGVQASYWRDSESLWTHALTVNPTNGFAQFSLGDFLLNRGRLNDAIEHFRIAVTVQPWLAPAHFQLGLALSQKGEVDAAIAEYRTVLSLGSETGIVHFNLANALRAKGETDEAIFQYRAALKIQPDYADAETNLGNALLETGNTAEALTLYQRVVALQPENALAHYNLAVALHRQRRLNDAIAHYQKALAIEPDYPDAHQNLGNALLQNGQLDEARLHLKMAENPGK
jgi:tetratricopeptide (TPR) repeat protein